MTVLHALLVRHRFLAGLVGRSTCGGITSARENDEAVELLCFRSPSEPCGGSGFICVSDFLVGLVGRSTCGGATSARCFCVRSSPSEPCGSSGSIIIIFNSQPTFPTDHPEWKPDYISKVATMVPRTQEVCKITRVHRLPTSDRQRLLRGCQLASISPLGNR